MKVRKRDHHAAEEQVQVCTVSTTHSAWLHAGQMGESCCVGVVEAVQVEKCPKTQQLLGYSVLIYSGYGVVCVGKRWAWWLLLAPGVAWYGM